MKRIIWSVAIFLMIGPYRWLVLALGPRLSLKLAGCVGAAHYRFMSRRRRAALAKIISDVLEIGQGSGETRAVVREYVINRNKYVVDGFLRPRMGVERFQKELLDGISGVSFLDESLAEGKGVVVCHFHFGSIYWIFPALASLGHSVASHRFRDARYGGEVWRWVRGMHLRVQLAGDRSQPAEWVYHEPGLSIVRLVRSLRGGGILCMNAGGRMGSEYVEVPFFSAEMDFLAGPALVAALAEAPILPVFCTRTRENRYHVAIEPPIRVGGSSKEQVTDAIARLARVLERYVRRHPAQWHRWRELGWISKEGGRRLLTIRPDIGASMERTSNLPKGKQAGFASGDLE